ncbi:MAG: hypothetical protein KDC87_03655, partial [Planctomycetes bacterium]|nr:hypothetical protein [Planctomycetota bacterium]
MARPIRAPKSRAAATTQSDNATLNQGPNPPIRASGSAMARNSLHCTDPGSFSRGSGCGLPSLRPNVDQANRVSRLHSANAAGVW